MPWASFSMLDGPDGTGCDVIHIIVQDQDGQNNNTVFILIGSNKKSVVPRGSVLNHSYLHCTLTIFQIMLIKTIQ